MPSIYQEFARHVARHVDDRLNDRRAAERARAASAARKEMGEARDVAARDAAEELERLRACGLITEAEYQARRARPPEG